MQTQPPVDPTHSSPGERRACAVDSEPADAVPKKYIVQHHQRVATKRDSHEYWDKQVGPLLRRSRRRRRRPASRGEERRRWQRVSGACGTRAVHVSWAGGGNTATVPLLLSLCCRAARRPRARVAAEHARAARSGGARAGVNARAAGRAPARAARGRAA